MQKKAETSLKYWRNKEKKALELLRIVGELRFDRSIELILFRRDIYDSRPSEVLNDHLFAKNYVNKPITIEMSLSLAKCIAKMNITPSRIDLGTLALNWLSEEDDYTADLDKYVWNELRDFTKKNKVEQRDVVLYGFGRIGRLLTRRIIALTGKGEQLRLKAIVIRPALKDRMVEMYRRASLLRKDSVHGKFRGTIVLSEDGSQLYVNGNEVQIIYATSPDSIDYTTYGIKNALLIDNSGAWRDKEGLSQHLQPGVDRVLLTAPGADIPNVIYGVNHDDVDLENENIFSAASCTTNAIVPVLSVIQNEFGIETGHIESIHAYTNSQNLLDNIHKKPRRGRAAAMNMVITTTGAVSAVSKALPDLEGKLTASAVRVPTPDVSLAILNLHLSKEVTLEEINESIRQASLHGELVEQIKYSTASDLVSCDMIGSTTPSVFDSPSTIVSSDGKRVTLYVWYDNEYGYTCQVVRLAKHVGEVRRPCYY